MSTLAEETSLDAHGDAAAAKPSRLQALMQFELTKGRVKRTDLMHFSRQLAVFIKAGIPLLDALDTITSEMANKRFKEVLEDIASKLRGGSTLSQAVDAHPDVFPAYYRGILQSAELTGQLDTVLVQLSEYLEREVEARRRISAALTYPMVVVGLSIVVVVILTVYVLPRFQKFFSDLHAKLPLATRALLGFAHFMSSWGWLVAAVVAVCVFALVTSIRLSEKARVLRDRFMLRLPVVGDLIHHAILERFCRILTSMVTAGVPLPEALKVTTEAASNRVFRARLQTAEEAMLRGEGLAGPLARTGLFPASARQMFAVGESTGSLDDQLHIAAEYFDRELDYKLKRFTNLFEPAVLLFVGLIVGFVAIALVSAMYGIFRQVQV